MRIVAAALAAAPLAMLFSAPLAAASELIGQSAAVAVSTLQAKGYDVQVNGDQTMDLSKCTATNITRLSGSTAEGQTGVPPGSTVYVTISCD